MIEKELCFPDTALFFKGLVRNNPVVRRKLLIAEQSLKNENDGWEDAYENKSRKTVSAVCSLKRL